MERIGEKRGGNGGGRYNLNEAKSPFLPIYTSVIREGWQQRDQTGFRKNERRLPQLNIDKFCFKF